MQQVKAKKALGQHFLTDLSIAERIADSIASHSTLPVLEIGPGMGVLTQFLLEKGYDTHVIEIDTESVAYLRAHFPALEGRIIEGDFLKIPIEDYFPGEAPFCLIGNYPYNISSQIFFRMLDYRERIPCCAGMLQREVAQRLASPPGNKDPQAPAGRRHRQARQEGGPLLRSGGRTGEDALGRRVRPARRTGQPAVPERQADRHPGRDRQRQPAVGQLA